MTDSALTISRICKRRGKAEILRDISLRVTAGERVALLGHNGAGKSTLIKLVLGLTPVSSGEIRVCGSAPGSGLARRATAFLPEAVSFHNALTGREQLNLFARLAGIDAKTVPDLLARVGLSDAMDQRIGTWSKGMRQRLGLAQVLLGKPKVALLDEPTSGLDPVSRHDLYAIIDELAAQGTAVLIASHALTEVEARTDRIAILRGGELVADDTLNGLMRAAGLPTRMRIAVRDGQAGQVAASTGGTRVNGSSVEILCAPGQKMIELRRIAALSEAVVDFEMTPPTLEDIYRFYSAREQK